MDSATHSKRQSTLRHTATAEAIRGFCDAYSRFSSVELRLETAELRQPMEFATHIPNPDSWPQMLR
ncbi:uncharacterized protein MYCFIDRAFT_176429 [Pseudocercospora fijiensis CIRAD86]|uniref:Uncharacterized protein n=1 Tax=Pseudocercospora fijiensis (strain CIRAD86) TaxID=383855 RepID=M2YTN7_PSEFD|nr:uncharacterized protein MYCFIDRAFT_176429 [Pseudocercospora fijiensis CIRAD86]EME81115.1 hypothetical protein MYCFIDRAFT_176429 [Pseudocercospora fijiensis CIRAD86]